MRTRNKVDEKYSLLNNLDDLVLFHFWTFMISIFHELQTCFLFMPSDEFPFHNDVLHYFSSFWVNSTVHLVFSFLHVPLLVYTSHDQNSVHNYRSCLNLILVSNHFFCPFLAIAVPIQIKIYNSKDCIWCVWYPYHFLTASPRWGEYIKMEGGERSTFLQNVSVTLIDDALTSFHTGFGILLRSISHNTGISTGE